MILPQRLRSILGHHCPRRPCKPELVLNCGSALHAAVEAVTSTGVRIFEENFDKCVKGPNHVMNFTQKSEDWFLSDCLQFVLLVQAKHEPRLLYCTDNISKGVQCTTGHAVFHPAKSWSQAETCLEYDHMEAMKLDKCLERGLTSSAHHRMQLQQRFASLQARSLAGDSSKASMERALLGKSPATTTGTPETTTSKRETTTGKLETTSGKPETTGMTTVKAAPTTGKPETTKMTTGKAEITTGKAEATGMTTDKPETTTSKTETTTGKPETTTVKRETTTGKPEIKAGKPETTGKPMITSTTTGKPARSRTTSTTSVYETTGEPGTTEALRRTRKPQTSKKVQEESKPNETPDQRLFNAYYKLLLHQPKDVEQMRAMSLFCFALCLPGTHQVDLLQRQHEHRMGIFSCDEAIVVSNVSGEALFGSNTKIPTITVKEENIGSFSGSVLKTKIFIQAWLEVFQNGRYRGHDWVIKLEPDSVVVPVRLRPSLNLYCMAGAVECAPLYLQNDGEALHGPVEVFSRAAIQAYDSCRDRCIDDLDYSQKGEDWYLSDCMGLLRVPGIEAPNLLSEFHLVGNMQLPCTGSEAIMHPFKDWEVQKQCLKEIIRAYNVSFEDKFELFSGRTIAKPMYFLAGVTCSAFLILSVGFAAAWRRHHRQTQHHLIIE